MEIVFPLDDRSSDSVDCLECAQPGQIDTWQGEINSKLKVCYHVSSMGFLESEIFFLDLILGRF